MNEIQHYFKHLTPKQLEQLEQLEELYTFWNSKINVISRKNMQAFYTQHVLHSLSIAKVIQFAPNTQIMDLGTGGGFPGIPIAIIFPQTKLLLVDSIGKKIKVVQDVIDHLQLNNASALCERAENVPQKFDFIITRAVTNLADIIEWTKNKISTKHNNNLPNGWLCLKGGDISKEFGELSKGYEHKVFSIADFFDEDFFKTKKIVYLNNQLT